MFTENSYHFSQTLPLSKEQETLETVILKTDRQLYGLPLKNVVEIIRMVAITPIPEAGRGIEGVINLRGEVVPVLDLRKCLGLEVKPYTLNTHIIITQTDGRNLGLVVDGVAKVADIPKHNIRPSQQLSPSSKHILGVAKTGDGLLIILKIASILRQILGDLPEKIYPQAGRRKTSIVSELVTS